MRQIFSNTWKVISEIPLARFVFGFFKFLHNGYLLKRKKDVLVLSHFGLGDQLIIGNFLNSISASRKVVLPVDNKYASQLSQFYSYNPNLQIAEIGWLSREFYPRGIQIKQLRRRFELPIVDIGRNVIYFLSFFYRAAGVSKLYYKAGWNSGTTLFNFPAYRHHYRENLSINLDHGYAFVDHHVGTDREIPNHVLESVRQSGLDLKLNDRNMSLIDQICTIIEARELHLVASAPFCLALVLPCKADVKVFYETRNQSSTLGDEGLGWSRQQCV